ncbi:MAG: hypothetical protein ACYS26_11495 [Planctomycetota bacterium]|jgi:hypothetical protein
MLARLALATLGQLALSLAPAHADISVLPDGSIGPVVGLAQALALAAPGETLFLMPGDYAGVAIDAQSVRIIGPGEDRTTIGRILGSPSSESLSVRNLAFDQEVFLSGVRLDQLGASGAAPTLLVEDCEGPVVLHDVTALCTASAPVATITANRVSTLVLDRCEVLGAVAPFGSLQLGSPALRVEDSRTFVNHSTLTGGYTDFDLFGPTGQVAIATDGGELFVHGGEIRGGAATIDPSDTTGVPGAAISGGPGRIEVSGAYTAQVVGGAGFSAPSGDTPGAVAVSIGPGCDVIRYGGVQIQGGLGGDGATAGPFLIFVAGELIEIADGQHRPGLAAEPPVGAPGSAFDLVVEGTPDRLQFVFFNLGLKRAYPLTGFEGLALLEPAGAELFLTPTLDASGSATAPIAVPAEPLLVGINGWLQSYEIQDDFSTLRLGLPAGFGVR